MDWEGGGSEHRCDECEEGAMAARCRVCDHAQRAKIERGLVAGASMRGMGKEYRVGRMSLARHRDEHLAGLMERAKARRNKAEKARGAALRAEARAREVSAEGTELELVTQARRCLK